MSDQQEQSQITPELQFDVQLRAAALEQAIRVATAGGTLHAAEISGIAMVFLQFLRTGIGMLVTNPNEGEDNV